MELPKHVRAPSAYEQHWIRYALGGVAAGYAATFVYRCAQVAATADLQFPAKKARRGMSTGRACCPCSQPVVLQSANAAGVRQAATACAAGRVAVHCEWLGTRWQACVTLWPCL